MSSFAPHATSVAITLPLLFLTWRLSGRFLYTYFSRKTTVVHEIGSLGEARPSDKKIKGTAVIIGGR